MASGKSCQTNMNFLSRDHFSHDVLPIVMGSRPEDYARDAPAHSYIHVDEFKGPKELADYLHQLDKDDEKYNEYFQVMMILFSAVFGV